MKKEFLFLITILLFSVIVISCKKACVCYGSGNERASFYNDPKVEGAITTEEECKNWFASPERDSVIVRCEWERW